MHAAFALADAFWRLSTFRLRPQDLPRSTVLLALATAANVFISIVISALLDMPAVNASVETCVLIGMTAALLYAFARGGRIVQTLTALMGTSTVIGVIVALLIIAFHHPPQSVLPQALRIAIFLWNMFVIAHILRHALDTVFILGCVIAFAYALALDSILRLLTS
jgi:hypothetical protein